MLKGELVKKDDTWMVWRIVSDGETQWIETVPIHPQDTEPINLSRRPILFNIVNDDKGLAWAKPVYKSPKG